MARYTVWANIPHYCVVTAATEEQAKQAAVDGGYWEAAYNQPMDVADLDHAELEPE